LTSLKTTAGPEKRTATEGERGGSTGILVNILVTVVNIAKTVPRLFQMKKKLLFL
jgi:hypothetical protein